MTDKLTTEDVLRKLNADLEAQVLEMEGDIASALTKLNIAKGQASERARRIRELSRAKEYWRKRCVDLEEQIEADDVDFMRVLHAREVEKLKVRIDHLEGLCWKLRGENEQLRELVKEMYFDLCTARPSMTVFEEANPYMKKLEQLGFLDGEQND